MWVVENNNGPVKYSPSKELVIDYATENYKIKAQVVYLNENFIAQSEVLSESEVENINVNTSFFAKLISFFRGLFGNLPVWIDNVEQ